MPPLTEVIIQALNSNPNVLQKLTRDFGTIKWIFSKFAIVRTETKTSIYGANG